jgi:hypothetical protein
MHCSLHSATHMSLMYPALECVQHVSFHVSTLINYCPRRSEWSGGTGPGAKHLWHWKQPQSQCVVSREDYCIFFPLFTENVEVSRLWWFHTNFTLQINIDTIWNPPGQQDVWHSFILLFGEHLKFHASWNFGVHLLCAWIVTVTQIRDRRMKLKNARSFRRTL